MNNIFQLYASLPKSYPVPPQAADIAFALYMECLVKKDDWKEAQGFYNIWYMQKEFEKQRDFVAYCKTFLSRISNARFTYIEFMDVSARVENLIAVLSIDFPEETELIEALRVTKRL